MERNQEMINASNFCVFYYNPAYLPPKRKQSKKDVNAYKSKSGTELSWYYVEQKKRAGKCINVINFYE